MAPVTIERQGHRGDGIAAGPVYAARTLPGEVVAGAITGNRIADPQVDAASPHRVMPSCPHYDDCGGCALQHAEHAYVAGWKVDVVRQALAAQGLGAPIKGIATSPPASRRRAVLSGRRTRDGATLGFHARASDRLSAVDRCRVVVPEILAALPALTDLVAQHGSRKGELTIGVTHGPAGLDVAVTGGAARARDALDALGLWAARHDIARLTWNGDVLAQARPPVQIFGGARVVPPPGAFLQATRHGEAALLASVTQAVGDAPRIADLFAGCGTFALPLSRRAQVHAVEGDRAMIDALLSGGRAAMRLGLTGEVRDLFRRPLEPSDLRATDAVVIDPPRAGAEAQMRCLAASEVGIVASVSCDAATFARDARILTDGGYHMDWVRVIDQFRWSPHVEVVARLRRNHIPAQG